MEEEIYSDCIHRDSIPTWYRKWWKDNSIGQGKPDGGNRYCPCKMLWTNCWNELWVHFLEFHKDEAIVAVLAGK